MIEVAVSTSFQRAYRKRVKGIPDLEQKFARALTQLADNPFEPRLRTHKLTGELSELWSFTVAYDCRVVFRFVDDKHLVLLDIGTHDEVY
jgi:addiction module RelE/StbE family toxin